MTDLPDQEALVSEIVAFRGSFNVLQLATADAGGQPEASHAPFVRDEAGCFLILVSGLARHTQNLLQQPSASVLLLENQVGRPNPFALRRLQYLCSAEIIDRKKDVLAHEASINLFREVFGKFVDTLNALGDFQVVRLTPESGKYVRGFAQTFTLDANDSDSVVHVTV